MNVSVQEKQLMLEQSEVMDRATLTLKNLTKELQMLEMKNEIQTKVKTDIDQQQREFFLNQQMKQIQEELGGNPAEQELEELKKNFEGIKILKFDTPFSLCLSLCRVFFIQLSDRDQRGSA